LLACSADPTFAPEDRGDRAPEWQGQDDEELDPFDLGDAQADARLLGEGSYDLAGWSAASAGDVDGDGFGDLVIGAPGEVSGGGEAGSLSSAAGAAYLVAGPIYGEMSLEAAETKFQGAESPDIAGFGVAPAGDADGDGRDEFLIGAPGYLPVAPQFGKAYLAGGSDDALVDLGLHSPVLSTGLPENQAGYGLAGGGDVDGDGMADVLVGDTTDTTFGELTGAVYVVLGPIVADIELSDSAAHLAGENGESEAGEALAFAGDLDDDGRDDFLVGAAGSGSEGDLPGTVYLVHGPVDGDGSLADAEARMTGESAGDGAGTAVGGGHDIDGDGIEDILVGAPRARSDDGVSTGVVYLVLGPVSGNVALATADARWMEDQGYQNTGEALASCGDVDGDGLGDVLIGHDAGGYLITATPAGDASFSQADFDLTRDGMDAWTGSVAAAGDVDGDGLGDFCVAADMEDGDHQAGGAIYLFYGGPRFAPAYR